MNVDNKLSQQEIFNHFGIGIPYTAAFSGRKYCISDGFTVFTLHRLVYQCGYCINVPAETLINPWYNMSCVVIYRTFNINRGEVVPWRSTRIIMMERKFPIHYKKKKNKITVAKVRFYWQEIGTTWSDRFNLQIREIIDVRESPIWLQNNRIYELVNVSGSTNNDK